MKSDIHTLSDSLLWKRFLEGDSSAYTQIYNQTVQDLFRFGLLYTSDHCCPIKIAKRSLKYLKFSSLQRFFESTDLNL